MKLEKRPPPHPRLSPTGAEDEGEGAAPDAQHYCGGETMRRRDVIQAQ